MATTDTRPNITKIESSSELRRWYWLKSELSAESRRLGLKVAGAKFTILERLCHFHETGNQYWSGDIERKATSKFDWHSGVLTKETVVSDNYKNTQNVRQFFKANAGPEFKFTIDFLEWFKKNTGKTLGDAVVYWQTQKADTSRTKIKPHNQFNQYCRDFMEVNPNLVMKDARKAWALKKSMPSDSGKHVYESSDLELLRNLTKKRR